MLVGLMSTMSGREAAAQANNKKLRGLPAGTLKYCAVHMNPVSGVADHRLYGETNENGPRKSQWKSPHGSPCQIRFKRM